MTGHLVILSSARNRERARRMVAGAPDNALMVIKPPKRTIPQNDKLWAMLSDVSRAKPGGRTHPPETWKALFMHALKHEVGFVEGLDGHPFPVGFRSSRLTVGQMSDLIEFIYAWCSDYDVSWSDEAKGSKT